MRTRIAALPFAFIVAFALFMPSFSMIDVFQAQTPEAMILAAAESSTADAVVNDAPWSVADEGSDDMDPFTPLVPPQVPLTSTTAALDALLPPLPLSPMQLEHDQPGSLPPSPSQEVPTTPPLQYV